VSDFGIARAVEDVALTASGAVVGTPAFMSPEQCSGQPLGPQCDQYSLGVVAFQMVTGSVPFMAPTLPGIMQQHFFTPVPDIEQMREGVPAELRDLITRSLAKKPEARYASTDDMLAAVEAIPFSDSTRKRAEAALRELARGVGIGRISVTVPGRGEATIVRDVDDASAPPGTPEMLDITGALGNSSLAPTRPMRSDPDGALAGDSRSSAGDPGAAYGPRGTRAIAVGDATHEPAVPIRRSDATRSTAASGPGGIQRTRPRRLFVWLAMAGLAIALLVAAALVLQRNSALRRADRAMETAQPFVDRAIAAKARGDAATARRELSSALEIAPRHPVALREMGTLMYGVGNYDLARSFLLNAVRADPNDRAAMQGLACSLVRLRRPDDAQRFFDRAGGQATDCR
jgi:hypothetical protein